MFPHSFFADGSQVMLVSQSKENTVPKPINEFCGTRKKILFVPTQLDKMGSYLWQICFWLMRTEIPSVLFYDLKAYLRLDSTYI